MNISNLRVDQREFMVAELCNKIIIDSIEGETQDSSVIEAILWHLPLPAFYGYYDDKDSLHLVTGNRIFASIENYIDNKYPITFETMLDMGNSIYFKDLELIFKRRIRERYLVINKFESFDKEVFEYLKRTLKHVVSLSL